MSGHYRAVVCRGFGVGETRVEDLPRPPLAAGQVRVKLEACGVNFPDVLIVQGKYQLKPPFPFVPGVEAAGGVVETGPGIATDLAGASVIVKMRMGAFAEEAVVPADSVIPLPQEFSFEEGATFMVAHTTSYHALITCAQVSAGHSVLVLGAGGGVGRAAVQIAKHHGAFVIGTATSAAKAALAGSAGADAVLEPALDQLPLRVGEALRVHNGRGGVDVIYDPVGLAPETLLRCLTWGGKILLVGFAGGTLPNYAANRILLKGASVIGVRAGEFGRQFPERRRAEMEQIVKLAAVHRPAVTAAFPLDRFDVALAALESRTASGRVVLTPA